MNLLDIKDAPMGKSIAFGRSLKGKNFSNGGMTRRPLWTKRYY